MTVKRLPLLALLAILGLALALRLWGIGFGLPSIYDNDEPLFVVNGGKLLVEQTLNPGWFGHPATTTFYALAIIDLVVYLGGWAMGHWDSPATFAQSIYADPSILFLSGRLFIAACGVACVALTFLVAKRLAGVRVAATAALLLALSPLHITYSQIIRSDVQASAAMMLCVWFAIREAGARTAMLAGAMAGLACATKWPAALIGVVPVALALTRAEQPVSARLRRAALIGVSALVTLILVSPYLLLDWQTVVANLTSEGRSQHPGATGGSPFANLLWYLQGPLPASFGLIALLFALPGAYFASRDRVAGWALLAPALLFAGVIISSALVWERWTIPLLPFVAILIAIGVERVVTALAPSRLRDAGWAAAVLLLSASLAVDAWRSGVARSNDTRDMAAAWVMANVPRDRSIAIEHIAYKLYAGGWGFRYPMGALGCLDGVAVLEGRVDLKGVEKAQKGRAAINLGSIDPARIESCRADYMVLTEYDDYASEAPLWRPELAVYHGLMRGMRPCEVFKPSKGVAAGPVVRIFAKRSCPFGS